MTKYVFGAGRSYTEVPVEVVGESRGKVKVRVTADVAPKFGGSGVTGPDAVWAVRGYRRDEILTVPKHELV